MRYYTCLNLFLVFLILHVEKYTTPPPTPPPPICLIHGAYCFSWILFLMRFCVCVCVCLCALASIYGYIHYNIAYFRRFTHAEWFIFQKYSYVFTTASTSNRKKNHQPSDKNCEIKWHWTFPLFSITTKIGKIWLKNKGKIVHKSH